MTPARIKEVLQFTRALKGRHPLEIEDVFSNGFCYWFAKILEERFQGTILFDPFNVHFATLIDDCIFDINGLADTNNVWYNWEDYKHIEDVSSIIHSCILKDY